MVIFFRYEGYGYDSVECLRVVVKIYEFKS